MLNKINKWKNAFNEKKVLKVLKSILKKNYWEKVSNSLEYKEVRLIK